MRILYVIDQMAVCGGTERIIADKVNWLAENTPHEIFLMTTLSDRRPFAYNISGKAHVLQLGVNGSMKSVLSLLKAVLRYNKVVKEIKPDITVAIWTFCTLMCLLGGRYGTLIQEQHVTPYRLKKRWLIRWLQRRIDRIVVVNNEAKKYYGAEAKVEVIPNFTSIQPGRDCDYTVRHCIAMGRLAVEKDFSRMLRLWHEAVKCCPGWILDIYGEGEERAALERQIDELKMHDEVSLHGQTADPADAYCSGSMCLMTSQNEEFPLSLVEAMTCGLPLLAFDCPSGPREIIEDGRNGRLIAYHDDTAMVDALVEMMHNVDMRHEMGATGKAMAVRYVPESVMPRWLSLFDGLTGKEDMECPE